MGIRKISLIITLSCFSCLVNASGFMFKHLEAKDGLSNNQVLDIFKDSEGFMWFATASGLNRYDGYQVTVFRSYDTDPATLPDNYTESIQEDNKGNLWILTGAGYALYNRESETFNRDVRAWLWEIGIDGIPALVYIDHNKSMWFYVEGKGCYLYIPESQLLYPLLFDVGQLPKGEITDIAECKEGVLLVYNTGRLVCLDFQTNKIKWQQEDLMKELGSEKQGVFTLFVDSEDDLWIYGPLGMWVYNPEQKKWQSHLCDLIKRQSHNRVRAVAQDKQGRIWIGKDREGIDILDKETGEVRQLRNKPDDERSLQNNAVMALYEDSNDIMWVGTYKKGVSYFNESIFKFGIEHLGDITCMEEDQEGRVWLGTDDTGIIYWNSVTGEKSAFLQKNNTELITDAIGCMLKAADGKLWIGTLGGGLLGYDNGRIIHYKKIQGQQNSLIHDKVCSLAEDREGNIWLGTSGGGIQSLNPKTGLFTTYNENSAGLISDHVSSLCMGKDGSLWIGTAQGLSELDIETKKMTNLTGTKSGKERFSNQNISQVYEDSRGLIWIGTREGLNVYNPKTDELTILGVEQGLSSPIISGIVEDDDKNIWVTTAHGITHVIPSIDSKTGHYTYRSHIYAVQDGLQNGEFNQRSIRKLSSGEILMGGVYGISRFRPDDIKYNKILPKVVFTRFLLFNEEVKAGKEYDGRLILEKALNQVGQVELSYGQNIFSIQFASDNYILPEKMKYSYKLEGFNDEWLTTTYGKVTYTNLDPGTYMLKVKATNSDGYSGDEEASLKIVIHPPFRLSIWAYIIYGLLAVAALMLARHWVLRRERNKYKMQQIEQEAGKNQEKADVNDDLIKGREYQEIAESKASDPGIDIKEDDKDDAPEGVCQEDHPDTEIGSGVGMVHEVSVFHPEPDFEAGREEEPNHIITIEGLEEDIRRLEAGDTEDAVEEQHIDTISTIAPQRATVIQLTEGEGDQIITHIIPPQELPEVMTVVSKAKKSVTPLSLAAKDLIGGKDSDRNHSSMDTGLSETTITSMEEKLIDHAVKYVEDNISRSDLSVEELSRELGMSRVHLYKKLLAITGKTPIEFIRVIRLKRAAQLLRESQQNISEIAYQVGFNNPKYFSKYFKEEFGMLPSAYQNGE